MIDYETLSTQTGIALPPLLKEFLASGKTHYGPDWADTWRQRCLQDPPLFMSWQDFEWIDAEASREIIEGWLNPSAQNGRRFLPFAQSGAGDAWCLTPLDTHGVGVALVLHDDEASSVAHACFDDFVCAGFLQAFADLSDQLDEFSEPEALQLLQADVAQTTRFMTQELGGYLQDFCRRPLEIRPWRDGPRARVRQVASLISQDELAAENWTGCPPWTFPFPSWRAGKCVHRTRAARSPAWCQSPQRSTGAPLPPIPCRRWRPSGPARASMAAAWDRPRPWWTSTSAAV